MIHTHIIEKRNSNLVLFSQGRPKPRSRSSSSSHFSRMNRNNAYVSITKLIDICRFYLANSLELMLLVPKEEYNQNVLIEEEKITWASECG